MSVTASEGFTTEFRTQLAIVVKFFLQVLICGYSITYFSLLMFPEHIFFYIAVPLGLELLYWKQENILFM